jgi:hypothetical protein
MANIVISYDISNKDVPVLIVAREGLGFSFSPRLEVIKTFTGDEAITLYHKLTSKEDN